MRYKTGKKYVRVYLGPSDMNAAFRENERREKDAAKSKRGNTGGAQRSSLAKRTGHGIYGTAAEMAVASTLSREWTGRGGSPRDGDVDGLEVKYTSSPNLLIQPNNPDGRYVLVTGGRMLPSGEREFVIRGYIDFNKEAMASYYGPFAVHGEGYSIPITELRSVGDLLC